MKVIVSAVGVHDGERWLRSVRSAYDWFKFRDMVHEESKRRVVTGEKSMIYRYDIYPNDPDAIEKPVMTFEEHGAEDVTHVDIESVEACFRYKPDWVVDRISPRPVLFFAAEYDSIVPPEEIYKTYEIILNRCDNHVRGRGWAQIGPGPRAQAQNLHWARNMVGDG